MHLLITYSNSVSQDLAAVVDKRHGKIKRRMSIQFMYTKRSGEGTHLC